MKANKVICLKSQNGDRGFEVRVLVSESVHMLSVALLAENYSAHVRGDTPTVPSRTPVYSLPVAIT